ncbi:MAG: DUF2156 domain-containing protein, partial [Clostridia bacterium]|nr:DUF2156 domain-containing protein [Clostridia bacterium]
MFRARSNFLKKYAEEKKLANLAEEELSYSAECTELFEKLGLSGIYVEAEGAMIAYTLGEKCGKTHIIHIEKALRKYEGAYPFTANAFAKTTSAEYINREDDSGDEGLRTSKLQYHPIEILNKYTVSVLSPQDKIGALPALTVGDLTLSALASSDARRYFDLNTDDENNKFWGYDYRKDIKEPTPQ